MNPMEDVMTTYMEEVLNSLKGKIQSSKRGAIGIRVKNLMQKYGQIRRSQSFVDYVNQYMDQLGLTCDPQFSLTIPYDAWLSISLKSLPGEESPQEEVKMPDEQPGSVNLAEETKMRISVPEDFFFQLFDFGSHQEFQRFQACLDSNVPIGIFLIPKANDFFSDLVEKILLYEIVRRRQYRNVIDQPYPFYLNSSQMEFNFHIDSDKAIEEQYQEEKAPWANSDIFHFNESTMFSVILGETGKDILDSEKFDSQFKQLSLFANKYCSKQFFILFHCPPESKIIERNGQDILGLLIESVSKRLPYVFKLRSKYGHDGDITLSEKEKMLEHFKVLLEVQVRNSDIDLEASLSDMFIDLQKLQNQGESQILLQMKPEHFLKLRWGNNESNEHVYLKYFAINTLEQKGFNLSDISCEAVMEPIDDEGRIEHTPKTRGKKPDVSVKNNVVVEIETLRKKAGDENVYLDLIKNLSEKMDGWQRDLKSIWLVLPGFEIARNYYQVKKTKDILEDKVKRLFGDQVIFEIMAPDYLNHVLLPVSFENIDYPASPKLIPTPSREAGVNVIGKTERITFQNVQGLFEEKERLNELKNLRDKLKTSGIGGILLFGLPGCGKTLLANAFANESERYFLKCSPAEIQSVWIGQTQKNVRNIFSQAKVRSPSLLFIDELDSIGFSRMELQAHTDQKATINQLLIEMNNIGDYDVIVVAATNLINRIDSALRRSGRFDWKVPIFPPDSNERAKIFQHYVQKYIFEFKDQMECRTDDIIDYQQLGIQSDRLVSSDIDLICKEIRNKLLLKGNSLELNTKVFQEYVDNFKKAGLSINKKDVQTFLKECEAIGVHSDKLGILKKEWEIM
jgi:GTPase SAR1 family protein